MLCVGVMCASGCYSKSSVLYCSLSMFVSDALGDHMVEAYSSMGLIMALYVASMVSLCLPHFIEMRTLSMVIVLRALVADPLNSICRYRHVSNVKTEP